MLLNEDIEVTYFNRCLVANRISSHPSIYCFPWQQPELTRGTHVTFMWLLALSSVISVAKQYFEKTFFDLKREKTKSL